MIFPADYDLFLAACQDILRRRERAAKPLLHDRLLQSVNTEVPNAELLGHIIAESLLKRIDRNLVEAKNIYLESFDIPQIELFYTMCKGYPQVPQAHAVANTTLATVLRQEKRGALFEIGVGKGVQVASLVQALAERPGRLRDFTVLALDPDPANLRDAQARITALKTPFTLRYHSLNTLLEHCHPRDFFAIAERAGPHLAVNAAYTLHHTLHPVHDHALRTQLLRRIHDYLKPQVFTLIEPNANHDTEHLTRRLHACWEHFGTVFDLIDQADIGPEHRFVIKEKFFGREIRDIFGTSDAFRCERHEHYESWLLRFAKAGFAPFEGEVPLPAALPEYCSQTVTPGLVRLGYRGLPLIAVFAMSARGPRGGAQQ